MWESHTNWPAVGRPSMSIREVYIQRERGWRNKRSMAPSSEFRLVVPRDAVIDKFQNLSGGFAVSASSRPPKAWAMDIAAVHDALSCSTESLIASEELRRRFATSIEVAARWLALNLDDR